MLNIVWVSPQGHRSVSVGPFHSAGTAVSLFRAKMVQQRTNLMANTTRLCSLRGEVHIAPSRLKIQRRWKYRELNPAKSKAIHSTDL